MKTTQLYIEDSYLKSMEAKVLAIESEATGKWRLILDQTAFYPMGGGQPTDQGTLVYGDQVANVYQVMNKDGEIWHYITASAPPQVGQSIHGEINWERRYKNMRAHSAGHVLDFALYQLGYSPKTLSPLKGDHGKKPYIMYQGVVDKDILADLMSQTAKLIDQNLKFTTLFQPLADLQKEALYLQPGLPTNKPLRTLRLESVGAVADGGTQVHSTKEIGKVTVTKLEIKDGCTVVNYTVS